VAVIAIAPLLHWGIAGFLVASYGIQLSSGLALLLVLRRRFGLTLPRLAEYRIEDVRALVGSGGLFFLLQIGVMIGWDMDSVVLSAFVGPAAVAVYSVVQRMFLLVSGPLSMLNAPLWASYADAHARGDFRYLRATLRRALLATFCLATAGASVVVALHAPLAQFLSKDVLQIPAGFVLMFGAWAIVSATGDALAMYMNGVHILFPQIVACLTFVVVAIILKLALVQSHGLEGVILGSLGSYLLTTVLLFLTVFRRALFAPLQPGADGVPAHAPRAG
jgi:O-antigen/teichoic acid export membrane protein